MSFGHKIIVRRSTPWSIYSVKNCLSLAHPHTSLHRRDHQLRHFSENPHQQRLREIVSNEGIERPAVLRQQVGEVRRPLSQPKLFVKVGAYSQSVERQALCCTLGNSVRRFSRA
eukprot:GHVN01086773.1.p3 GENE.GHVN01086773.1~~GHVN01086773.1.p3  ORF type:complete len:114 (-),score=9.34 GHVN01086773.1:1606-1947(-)